MIGYDPFDKEAEEDKPLLYAQLIGYIDMSGDNEDMTRILDSIEIVRGYLQLQKLNDMSDVDAKKLLIDLFLDKVIVTDQHLDIKLSSDAITNMLQK